MAEPDHEQYATDILGSLASENSQSGRLRYELAPAKSRNAARSMTTIIAHRLLDASGHAPAQVSGTNFDWKKGLFICRNITDRDYLWTNIRRKVADDLHVIAQSRPTAYVMTCCTPGDGTLNVWTIPEPVIYDALSELPSKEGAKSRGGEEYNIEISPRPQRIERFNASPDFTKYFLQLHLGDDEASALSASRDMDDAVKAARKVAVAENMTVRKVVGYHAVRRQLAISSYQATQVGTFNPTGLADGRERVLSSIVRRRGQSKFRRQLLAAYKCRCAISGCDVDAILEGAHIIPYMGVETNHPANGLLLRTDLHTLFDLKLLTVDVPARTVLVSPIPKGSAYEELQG